MNRLYKMLVVFFVSMQICNVAYTFDYRQAMSDRVNEIRAKLNTEYSKRFLAKYASMTDDEIMREMSFALKYDNLYGSVDMFYRIDSVVKFSESGFTDEEKKQIQCLQRCGRLAEKKMLEGFEKEKRDLESTLKDVHNASIFSPLYLYRVLNELESRGTLKRHNPKPTKCYTDDIWTTMRTLYSSDNDQIVHFVVQFEEKNDENQTICRFIRVAAQEKLFKGLAAVATGTVTVVAGGCYALYKTCFAKKKTDEIGDAKKESVVETTQVQSA